MIEYQYRLYGINSNENNLIYIPLLKNAHSWGKKFFSHNFGCTEDVYIGPDNIELYKDKRFVVILRDPVDRWISAITQYLVHLDINIDLLDNPFIYKLITDGVVFDAHARPQHYDIIGLDDRRTAFFTCDEKLEFNLNIFSLALFNKRAEPVGEINRHHNNDAKKILYAKIKNMVEQDTILVDKLKTFYYMDYVLIEKVKHRFVNKLIDLRNIYYD
jgi:hypothetical protein